MSVIDPQPCPPSDFAPLSSAKGFAAHGADADFPRPAGYPSVEWQGTVEPNNSVDGDTFIDLS